MTVNAPADALPEAKRFTPAAGGFAGPRLPPRFGIVRVAEVWLVAPPCMRGIFPAKS
jgi:hypothetical protein